MHEIHYSGNQICVCVCVCFEKRTTLAVRHGCLLGRRRTLFTLRLCAVALRRCHGFGGGACGVTGLLLQRGGVSDGALVTMVTVVIWGERESRHECVKEKRERERESETAR